MDLKDKFYLEKSRAKKILKNKSEEMMDKEKNIPKKTKTQKTTQKNPKEKEPIKKVKQTKTKEPVSADETATKTNIVEVKKTKKLIITPNQITILRILLIPIMVFFYFADFIPYCKIIAAGIFLIAAATDFIDGYLARKTGLITDMGKFLDPIADKLLVMSALVLVITDPVIIAEWYIWAGIIAIIILAREFLVSALRLVAASKNIVMAADKWGKYKTFFQDMALLNFMIIAFLLPQMSVTTTAFNIYLIISYILIFIATLLTIISGINYFVKNKAVLCEKK
jgi:CDP-diacylglycerol--glycerol-3-phosphate 3-phosphatidyltransferase